MIGGFSIVTRYRVPSPTSARGSTLTTSRNAAISLPQAPGGWPLIQMSVTEVFELTSPMLRVSMRTWGWRRVNGPNQFRSGRRNRRETRSRRSTTFPFGNGAGRCGRPPTPLIDGGESDSPSASFAPLDWTGRARTLIVLLPDREMGLGIITRGFGGL